MATMNESHAVATKVLKEQAEAYKLRKRHFSKTLCYVGIDTDEVNSFASVSFSHAPYQDAWRVEVTWKTLGSVDVSELDRYTLAMATAATIAQRLREALGDNLYVPKS